MGWDWTLHTHYATGGAVEILTLVFEGFGERGFGGEGEVSGGGRHGGGGGGGGGQMDQLWESLSLQAMVVVVVVVGVEVESGIIPKLQMKFGAEKSAMFGCFETFFDNAYNVLAIRTSSLIVDLLLLSCQIVMLATAAVPPVQAEDITT